MRVGAYQFAVTGDINSNFEKIRHAVKLAEEKKVELLVFPECALTGYPPRDFGSPAEIEFETLSTLYGELQKDCDSSQMHLIVGTITEENGAYYNTAMLFSPFQPVKQVYRKRALWGWDNDHFTAGGSEGVFEIGNWKIGVRICFEIRFPEFFRQLYRARTDLNVVLFYDVSDHDDASRYEMIRSHILTRAVENVTYTLTADSISPFQTAPTALYGKSGQTLAELERNKEGLLLYELAKEEDNFGETGRRTVTDQLLLK